MKVYDGCETVQLFRYREEERLEEEEDFDDYEDMEEYFGSSEVSSLSAFSWQPLEEQSFYQKYYKAYQRMAAKELKLKEAKETEKNGLETAPSETIDGAVIMLSSEQLGDTTDAAIHDKIAVLDVNPGDPSGEGVTAGPSEGNTVNPSGFMESSCPIEARNDAVAAGAQKQPPRRQLIIGMSDATDEFTRRKALECGNSNIASYSMQTLYKLKIS